MTSEKDTTKVIEILSYILEREKESGAPIKAVHLEEHFGLTQKQAGNILYEYGPKRRKYLSDVGNRQFKLSLKGLKHLQREGVDGGDASKEIEALGDGSMPSQIAVGDAPKEEVYAKLTTEGDRFWKIGKNLNVHEGTLNTVTELVFQGNWQDPKAVWQVLKATNVRSDITGAWFRLWMLMQRQTIPEEIKGELPASPPEKEFAKEQSSTPAATRFTVAGDQIVPDPDGAFTFSQALQVRGQNMGMTAPQAPQMPPQDKPSETITAISTAMTAFSDKTGQKGEDPTQKLVLEIVKSLVENTTKSDANQEVLRRLERIEDKQNQPPPAPPPQQNPMEAASNQMGNMAHMMGFENIGALMGKLHGEGGGGASFQPQNFEQFMHMQDKWRGWNREDEDVKIKRDTTASMRQFVSNLAVSLPTAVQKMEAIIKEGGAPAEAQIPAAAPSRRVRVGQRPQVSAPEAPEEGMETITCGRCEKLFKVPLGAKEATCPHCGMYLVEAPRAEEPAKAEAPPTAAPKPEVEERPVGEVTPEKVVEEARAAAEEAKAEEPVVEMPEEAEAPVADRIQEAVESPSGNVETLGADSVHVAFEEVPQAEEGEAAETEEQTEKPSRYQTRGKAKRKAKGGK